MIVIYSLDIVLQTNDNCTFLVWFICKYSLGFICLHIFSQDLGIYSI